MGHRARLAPTPLRCVPASRGESDHGHGGFNAEDQVEKYDYHAKKNVIMIITGFTTACTCKISYEDVDTLRNSTFSTSRPSCIHPMDLTNSL